MSEPLDKAPSCPLSRIQWRVDGKPAANKPTVRYVPFMDATTVADLLDDWVGPENWRDDYSIPASGKGLYCHLSIRSSTGDWVTKTDIGVPSNFEGEKGQVSDAFKRVATIKWGVGRNVYELPMPMWAECRVDGKGAAYPTDRTLDEIAKKLRAAGVVDADEATKGGTTAGDGADHFDETPVASQDQVAEIRALLAQIPAGEQKDAVFDFDQETGSAIFGIPMADAQRRILVDPERAGWIIEKLRDVITANTAAAVRPGEPVGDADERLNADDPADAVGEVSGAVADTDPADVPVALSEGALEQRRTQLAASFRLMKGGDAKNAVIEVMGANPVRASKNYGAEELDRFESAIREHGGEIIAP